MLNVLMVGDVVGQPGCRMLRRELPRLKRKYHADLTIVNGENSAVGNGILPSSADWIFESGADVITGGNHSFQRREIYPYLEEHPQLLRPANYPACCEGRGVYVYELGRWRVAVVSLMGTAFLEPLESPFYAMDRILKETVADLFLVDFHAEATGEKYREIARAMGVAGVDEMSQEEYRKAAVEAVQKLSADVGIPAKLEARKEEDLQFLAESAYADACAPGNPKEASVEDLKALFRKLM